MAVVCSAYFSVKVRSLSMSAIRARRSCWMSARINFRISIISFVLVTFCEVGVRLTLVLRLFRCLGVEGRGLRRADFAGAIMEVEGESAFFGGVIEVEEAAWVGVV